MSIGVNVVVVTGASRGLGLGLAKEYSDRGCKIVATCRSPEKAEELAAFLKQRNHPPAITCDVSRDDSISRCVKDAVGKAGIDRVDLLVNNAGISNADHPDDPAVAVDRQELLNILNVNAAGPLAVTNGFLPLLKKSDRPIVVNVSSVMGSMQAAPRFSCTSYQASKSALNMITKCQAEDAPSIKFVAVHPGWVSTDLGRSKKRIPPLTVEQSAKAVAEVVEKVPPEDSGSFWSFEGTKLPF